jgi:Ni/Fe-hydrogenase subunit HybB-like protein
MGYGAVVALVNLLRLTWNAEQDQQLFAKMSKVNAGLLFFYVALRLADLAWSGKFRFFAADFPTFLFVVELAIFLAPAIMFVTPAVQKNRGYLFGAALLAVLAGAAYRVDTYMSVYRPAGWDANGRPIAAGWDYWPSLGETIVTVGMAAIGIAIFIFVSRLFPVVVVKQESHGHSHVASAPARAAGTR